MNPEMLVVENLSFTYAGSSTPVLQDINLEVRAGEFITITGPSGCGKSTLALALAGFIPHSVAGELQGNIYINGMNTRDYSPARLAGNVGIVQQDPEAQLCTLKVIDEIAFGPENLGLEVEEIRARVEWSVNAVGCHHLIDREVYSLSGGEKQRVAIAAILAMRPPVLILDEPTANLDPVGMKDVLSVIEKLRHEQNMTVIIIEHRLNQLLPSSDQLIVMRAGQIETDEEIIAAYKKQEFPSYTSHKTPALITPEDAAMPLLKVENLSAGYLAHTVLKDINFALFPGEIVAIMGDNGCGKTTLLRSLLGINKINSGQVIVKGQNVTNHKVAHRAKEIGLIFQNPNHQIFEQTVFKEAHLPSKLLNKKNANPLHTENIIKSFELYPYINDLPFILSLGEKKRLTLVSVLAYNPAILILDEPLVGQDEYRIKLFWEAILNHSIQGGTTLMVCHDPNFVEAFCDRIIFIKNDNILIDQPTNEAFQQMQAQGLKDYLPDSIVWGGA